MNRSDQDRLLRELLADDALQRTREEALVRGLGALHRRRRVRKAIASASGALLLAAWIAFVWRTPASPGVERTRADPISLRAATETRSETEVVLIDDEQLRALFSDRAFALIGAPGEQRFVFLDGASEPRGDL